MTWKKLFVSLLFILFLSVRAQADQCQAVLTSLKLPVNLKTKGKPAVAKWEIVDRILTSVRERAQGQNCEFTFGQIFQPGQKKILFPLTNNVLKTAPETSLEGVSVYNSDGELLGEFSNRVVYERSGGLYAKESYSLYYFQFRDSRGELQSSGSRLLLDTFVVKWDDIKDRPALERP